MEEPTPTFTERWLDTIQQFRYVLYIALVMEVLLLALSVAAAVWGPRDTETRTILLLDFGLLGLAFVITVGILSLCKRHTG